MITQAKAWRAGEIIHIEDALFAALEGLSGATPKIYMPILEQLEKLGVGYETSRDSFLDSLSANLNLSQEQRSSLDARYQEWASRDVNSAAHLLYKILKQ